jgi:hypothetical protein
VRDPTTNTGPRLLLFVSTLVVLVLLLELGVRSRRQVFANATNRGLAKAAICDSRPGLDLVFLGTSRSQDGISPSLVIDSMKEQESTFADWSGFNVAFSGANLGDLIELAPRMGAHHPLKMAVVEVSEPQLLNKAPTVVPAPPVRSGLEGRLSELLDHSLLIRYRKALLPEYLGRLLTLLLVSGSLEGWETRGSEQVWSWLGYRLQPASDFDPSLWSLEPVTPSASRQPLDRDLGIVLDRYVELTRQFGDRGVDVVFVVPPLSRDYVDAIERGSLRSFYVELARATGCQVWNFADLVLPDSFFSDSGHLSPKGRAHYSRALGRILRPKRSTISVER